MNIQKNSYIVCIAKVIVKPNSLDKVLEIFAELKMASIKESGCLRYELHQSQEDPLVFTFIDRFTSM